IFPYTTLFRSSQLMIFVNEANKAEKLSKEHVEGFVKLLSPVAPHIAEELWQRLGHDDTISYEPWPEYDATKLMDDEVEIVLQVMGKVRAKIHVPKDISKEELEKRALEHDKIKEWVA